MTLKIKENWKFIFYIAIATAVILVVFKLSYLADNNESIRNFVSDYGYGGIFLVSLASGFNFLIPVPAISFLPLFIISGLNIWLAILFIVLGTTLADVTAYIIGVIGQRALKSSTNEFIFNSLKKLRLHYYLMPIFALFLFAAFAPFPNEIVLVPLGFLGYRFIHILPVLLAGNSIFNILYAFGVVHLFKI